ncbi:membrane-bound PQQ-dependent dehydrogenase, glucose/quinate/shikimate family [Gallaecimonas mangrovi]|uniref:membrane-bound PQQ-dependent dehydrogenase, glucose/quinate/shikimate family n=1 Tax=Gallaecimonas mangrovi TaxID=2291597 RepID=UPI000E20235F|nr:membrane-bound PQQ-dependent dehydrogenase, glucose/quinate/shikimate family [Gallaecimonas mangrovi]
MQETTPSSQRDWPLFIFGIIMALCGLALAGGGLWLAALGGSWYYLLAGVAMLVSGVLLAKRRALGASIYGLVVLATIVWTAWESGLDYWRWVPRLDLIMVLAFVLAMLLPRLNPPLTRKISWSLAGVSGAVIIVAFALAFVPYHFTQYAKVPAPGSADDAAVINAGANAQPGDTPAQGDWTAYGRNNAADRFSPLTQITPKNVNQLTRAWQYRTGDIPKKRWGVENTPLKIGNQLYVCTPHNNVISLNANSGKENWRFDPGVKDKDIPYTAACRGVTYYVAKANSQALCATRIIEGTLDGRIIEIDAQTGQRCQDFGDNGQVNIKDGMGKALSGYVSITGVPVVVDGVVIAGHEVLDGQRRYEPSGVIKGFDAKTGELRWAWDMVQPDIHTLPPAGKTYTRGTPNMWTSATGDNQLGLVYLPMGNSTVDYWSSARRKQETVFSSSLVAINVHTGKPAWHFQTVHKDVWDYDLGSQVTLVNFPTDHGKVPAVILPSKQGDIYVLDRRTGKPLTEIKNEPAPQGGVEPAQRAKTQPHSLYHTLAKPRLTARDMWGISPFDQLACRIQFQQANYDGIYTPPSSNKPFIEYPSYNGGSDWGSLAVDPRRGVIIANYNDMPMYDRLVPREEVNKQGWTARDEGVDKGGAEGAGDPQEGTPYGINVNAGWRLAATGLICKEPPYGGIQAISLKTGKTLWDRPLGTARNNGPFGIASHLPINIGTPNNGGAVVTASGLIFIAAATDDLIRAIDINTGKTVWQDTLPAGGQANPMIYEQNGREYLVIEAGGHHFMETTPGDYVIAYALPRQRGGQG